MGITIDVVRLSADQAYLDAIGPNYYGYKPFFKNINYPVTAILRLIANWAPLGVLTPRFACVNQESSDHFSDIQPSIMAICQHLPTRESVFIKGHNHIFICPRIWAYREEPPSPSADNCPSVHANMYTRGIFRYRSNVILDALVAWRLQQSPVPLSNPGSLNDMVALDAQASYLSPKNYDAYISSKCL